jgi:hypothetical protein
MGDDGWPSLASCGVRSNISTWQLVSAVQDKQGTSSAELTSFVKKTTAVSSLKTTRLLAVILIPRFRDIRIGGRLRDRKGASLDPIDFFLNGVLFSNSPLHLTSSFRFHVSHACAYLPTLAGRRNVAMDKGPLRSKEESGMRNGPVPCPRRTGGRPPDFAPPPAGARRPGQSSASLLRLRTRPPLSAGARTPRRPREATCRPR